MILKDDIGDIELKDMILMYTTQGDDTYNIGIISDDEARYVEAAGYSVYCHLGRIEGYLRQRNDFPETLHGHISSLLVV